MQNYQILWINRFRNFSQLLHELTAAVEASRRGELSSLENQEVLRIFELTFDSARYTMADYLKGKQADPVQGAEETIKKASDFELIQNVDIWMHMLEDREKIAGFVDEEATALLLSEIARDYHPELLNLENRFIIIKDNENINRG